MANFVFLKSIKANFLSFACCLLLLILLFGSKELNANYHEDTGQQQFSCGKLFYSTFHLDKTRDVLFVGAMDNIFKLKLSNINSTNCLDDAVKLEPSDAQKCLSKGKSHYECRNHIKVIQPMSKSGDKLYVCGTNAYNPRDLLIHANNLSASSDLSLGIGGSAHAECPFDPDDNSTAVWVEKGNPSDLPALYSGTITEFSKADSIIFRSEIYNQSTGIKVHEAKRTTKYDSKWLDKPNFVGSFEIGDYVYFFFRESAVEYINCGKSIYSRVARVCKRDNGFKPAMSGKIWTSFLKARLNCSIGGEFPFYFDEIQSVYRNPNDESKFHAVFTTSSNGLFGSAICTFSLDSIQDAFNGKFKEQQTSSHAWLPVGFKSPANSNEIKPGVCVDDSLTLSDNLVNFIRGHPLMDSSVANDNGKPVFYKRQVLFTKIVVDVIEMNGFNYTVYFAATNTGLVYKIVEWYPQQQQQQQLQQQQQQLLQQQFLPLQSSPDTYSSFQQQQQPNNNGLPQSSLVEIISATSPHPIRAMEISHKHNSLYVSSDNSVKQISLTNCRRRHDSCASCVRDPYCVWDRKHFECKHNNNLATGAPQYGKQSNNYLQDVTGDDPNLCHNSVKHKEVRVTWGSAVHLSCPLSSLAHDLSDNLNLHSSSLMANNGNDALLQYKSSHLSGNLNTSPVTWHFNRNDNLLAPGFSLLERSDKFVLSSENGLVILSASESGWYSCKVNSQVIHKYNLIVDTKTCAAPSESEFKIAYANWCREYEKYKLASKSWHAKQNRCQALGAAATSRLDEHQIQLQLQMQRQQQDFWSQQQQQQLLFQQQQQQQQQQ